MRPIRLHINIDHVATVRNARGTRYPDPVLAAQLCEAAGADGITAHLREDRRHIRDDDVFRLKSVIGTTLNLEMAATQEMLSIAERVSPNVITLVPERREERTTEGGLHVSGQRTFIEQTVVLAQKIRAQVSLFVAPDASAITLAKELGADQIELHTGEYCHAWEAEGPESARTQTELQKLQRASEQVCALGMHLASGHGLTRHNVGPVVSIPGMEEVNIGHSVVADAVLFGLERAVRDLRCAIDRYRSAV